MSIKRIVHGDFTDPNGTRDITGIPVKNFEALITILMGSHQAGHTFDQMSDEELLAFVQATEDPTATIDTMPAVRVRIKELYASIIELLEAINQPYEGGIYDRPDGRVIIVEGKEVPLGPHGNS